MKLKFSVSTSGGYLYVQREAGDKPAKASGFNRKIHGWGADIHLYGMICKVLNAVGFGLVRKRMSTDTRFAHMYGDNYTPYVRTAIDRMKDTPHIWIVDGDYAIRSAAEDYNKGEEVSFLLQGDIFQKEDGPPLQPDWWRKVKSLCDAAGIECEICGDAKNIVVGPSECLRWWHRPGHTLQQTRDRLHKYFEGDDKTRWQEFHDNGSTPLTLDCELKFWIKQYGPDYVLLPDPQPIETTEVATV